MSILTIQEWGGQLRTLTLTGPALPFAGTLGFRSRTRLVTEQYGADADQQVVGDELLPTSPSGAWVTAQLATVAGPFATFAGLPLFASEDIAEAFEDLRQSAEILRVTYGPWVRYGRIESTDFVPHRAGRIEWRVDFAWTARASVSSYIPSLPTPVGGLSGFSALIEEALQAIDWFEDVVADGAAFVQDVLDEFVRGPLSVIDAGGAALSQAVQGISRAVEDLAQAGTDFVTGTTTHTEAVMRMGEISGILAAESIEMLAAIEGLTGCSMADADDPLLQLEAAQHVGAAARVSQALMVRAGEYIAASQRDGNTYRPEMTVHVAIEGEDLRSIARRYYSDPERWIEIALQNGLVGPTVYVGEEVVIP